MAVASQERVYLFLGKKAVQGWYRISRKVLEKQTLLFTPATQEMALCFLVQSGCQSSSHRI